MISFYVWGHTLTFISDNYTTLELAVYYQAVEAKWRSNLMVLKSFLLLDIDLQPHKNYALQP